MNIYLSHEIMHISHPTSSISCLFSFLKKIFCKVSPSDRPVCSSRLAEVMTVGLGEDVSIPCRVSASPTNLQFQWFFNSSDKKVKRGSDSVFRFNHYIIHSFIHFYLSLDATLNLSVLFICSETQTNITLLFSIN